MANYLLGVPTIDGCTLRFSSDEVTVSFENLKAWSPVDPRTRELHVNTQEELSSISNHGMNAPVEMKFTVPCPSGQVADMIMMYDKVHGTADGKGVLDLVLPDGSIWNFQNALLKTSPLYRDIDNTAGADLSYTLVFQCQIGSYGEQ